MPKMQKMQKVKMTRQEKIKARQQINLNNMETLKDIETKIFNPPVVGKSPEDKYLKGLQRDLYTTLELHMQMLLTEANSIDKELYIEKLKAKIVETETKCKN